MANLKWESLDNANACFRMRVFGGWMLKDVHCIYVPHVNEHGHVTQNPQEAVSMQFIPDANHEWDLKAEEMKDLLSK